MKVLEKRRVWCEHSREREKLAEGVVLEQRVARR